MLKGHPIAKATSRREVRDFMEQAGLPYEARNAGQLASMIATAADRSLVLAVVENGTGTMTFGGYYDADENPDLIARDIRRKRKVTIRSTMVINQPDTVL